MKKDFFLSVVFMVWLVAFFALAARIGYIC